MPTLRLTQVPDASAECLIRIELEGSSRARKTAAYSRLGVELTAREREEVRWYLEDFLGHSRVPAPAIALTVEALLYGTGHQLFEHLFAGDARELWDSVREELEGARFEIRTQTAAGTGIPWELLYDVEAQSWVALAARAFVRSPRRKGELGVAVRPTIGPVRILLVISRPRATEDVPFRSVAMRLLEGLAARSDVDVDVLRPPTFEQLVVELTSAHEQGRPYHVVHFDGHGIYDEERQRGFVVFESSDAADRTSEALVHGALLGRQLVHAGVPLLVLNACRSAHAEPPPEPGAAPAHEQPRAFGSFAEEAAVEGLAGVVAMAYNVYVGTAAAFVGDVYAALAEGEALGEAVTSARRRLQAQPMREVKFHAHRVQDWSVPVVFEAQPIRLFPKARAHPAERQDAPAVAAADPLPPRPSAGFAGRDTLLLSLDQAFSSNRIVLLFGLAGCGKSMAAAEFGRWYRLAAGELPVLFSSLATRPPVVRLLQEAAAQAGAQEAPVAASDRSGTLTALGKAEALWIWDDVDHVAPEAPPAPVSEAAEDLIELLREGSEAGVRFLLTSRRDERPWLGDLPTYIFVPRLPVGDRLEIARRLAVEAGRRPGDMSSWVTLLKWSRGHPDALVAAVSQAVRDGLVEEKDGLERFVRDLRAGRAKLDEDIAAALAASLGRGFESSFSLEEKQRLALLGFFQGSPSSLILERAERLYARRSSEAPPPLSQSGWISLLDRVAGLGLLSCFRGACLGHPLLPWLLRPLLDTHYPDRGENSARRAIERAYADAVSRWGNDIHRQAQANQLDLTEAIPVLLEAEDDLLHARELGLANRWPDAVIAAMQALGLLYGLEGRWVLWAKLVFDIVPEFVDPEDDGPRAGLEAYWGFVNDYRVRVARQVRNWDEAARLQQIKVQRSRREAEAALDARPDDLDSDQAATLRTLAVDLGGLADILREQGNPRCVKTYEEAIGLAPRIGDRPLEGRAAFGLGDAYLNVDVLYDLAAAERWYTRSLELLRSANCLGALGTVEFARFRQALAAGVPAAEAAEHLERAKRYCVETLRLYPPEAEAARAAERNQLGLIEMELATLRGDAAGFDSALAEFRRTIDAADALTIEWVAGQARENAAHALVRAGRHEEALLYANTAVRQYRAFTRDARARARADDLERFISEIELGRARSG